MTLRHHHGTQTHLSSVGTTRSVAAARPRRVLLVGVGDVVHAGLHALLSGSSEIEVVEAASGEVTDERADIYVVDVVGVLDAGEPVDAMLDPRRAGVVVLAIAPDGRPDLARRALSSGADGLLSLQWSADDIVATVVAATRDDFVRPVRLTCEWHDEDDDLRDATHGGDLTPRELQVLRLIAAGASNNEIAGRLFVSVNTVKTYVRTTYRRIDVTTRSQAMRWCFEHGLVLCPVPVAWTGSLSAGGVATGAPERRFG